MTARHPAVHVPAGWATNLGDIHRFTCFAAEFVDLAGVPDDLPSRIAR